jgi:hypothetical protein
MADTETSEVRVIVLTPNSVISGNVLSYFTQTCNSCNDISYCRIQSKKTAALKNVASSYARVCV